MLLGVNQPLSNENIFIKVPIFVYSSQYIHLISVSHFIILNAVLLVHGERRTALC